MATLLFFLEESSIEKSYSSLAWTPALSHDTHLVQIAGAAIEDEHVVYLASVEQYGKSPQFYRLLEISPFICHHAGNSEENKVEFDLVFTAYPDKHDRTYFGKAKTVAYFPAHYFVEMPDHYMNGRLFYLLRASRSQVDFFVFQNSRQLDFYRTFTKAFAGFDLTENSFILPYGISDSWRVAPESTRIDKRKRLAIKENDIVLLHGGGAWRWTDFYNFLNQYIEFSTRYQDCRLKLIIPGLSQEHNSDHNSYTTRIKDLLLDNRELFFNENRAANWSILFVDSWEAAASHMESFYAISDIGVSVSPNSLEYALSHRVRVVDYVGSGLDLLLSAGDSFSSARELNSIRTVVSSSGSNRRAYFDVFSKLHNVGLQPRAGRLRSATSARAFLSNSEMKRSAIKEMLSSTTERSIFPCPIDTVHHNSQVEMVRESLRGLFNVL